MERLCPAIENGVWKDYVQPNENGVWKDYVRPMRLVYGKIMSRQ